MRTALPEFELHCDNRVNRFALLLVLLFVQPFAPSLSAQISLSANFDHASLDVDQSTVAGNVVDLVGRDNFNSGQWKWIYFAAAGVMGEQPVFRIRQDFATGAENLANHAMVFSYDQQTWEFFDENFLSSSNGAFVFTHDTPFTADEVYIAYGLPYSWQRATNHIDTVIDSPWVSPTPSANEQLIIGHSPGGNDDLGRSIPRHPLYGYRITDPQIGTEKEKIILAGGVHANETLGNLTLEGAIDFLLGDSLTAAILRSRAEFYVYPMINPDGRFAGYNRSTVTRESADPNRGWDPPDYDTIPELETIGEAMRGDTAGKVDYLVDFHSTVVGKNGHFGYILPEWQQDPFWQAVLAHEPTVETRGASLITDTLAKFGRNELQARFSATFETQFIAGENIDRFLSLGENVAQSFLTAIWDFGDLNLDGKLDGADWLLLSAAAETDLAAMTPFEQYLQGDLDGDGQNSIADFGLFKDAYIARHGNEAFAQLVLFVPESTSVTYVFISFAIAIVRLRLTDL